MINVRVFKAGAAAQIALIVGVLGFVLLAPPEHGRVLLIPLTEAGARSLARIAVAEDARLLAAGPFGRSLIVEGDRARLAGPMLRAGIVPVAANTLLCGEIPKVAIDG